jgi:hypothetical protein
MADQYTTDPLPDNVTVPRTAPTLITPPAPVFPIVLPQPFFTPDEVKTHCPEEVINIVSDGDDSLLPIAITAATQEAMGYMSRYDYITILSQTGDLRDPILLIYLKDIALRHFMRLSNPNMDYEIVINNYKDALRWLEKIQGGKFIPAGWPLASPAFLSTQWHVRSREKRSNNY